MSKGKYKRKRERAGQRKRQEPVKTSLEDEVIVATGPARPSDRDGDNERKHGSVKGKKPVNVSLESKVIVNNEPEPVRGREDDLDNEQENSMNFLGLLKRSSFTDYIVAAFTVVLAGVSIYQGWVMRGQLSENQQEFTASHRPWVNIVEPTQVTQPLTFNSDGATVTVRYSVKNGGTAAAMNTVILDRLSIGTAKSPELEQQEARNSCDGETVSRFTGAVGNPLILPGDAGPSQSATLTLAKDKFEINGNYGVAVDWFGCIAYRDEFRKVHATAFVMGYVLDDGRSVFSPTGVVQGKFREAGIGTVY